jgi:hypothetical protein
MLISERREPLLQFPRLSPAAEDRFSNSRLALRPFGLYESDLNVDFSRPLRPFLVTEILECCTRGAQSERIEQAFFWNLPVGKRIECLLTLLQWEETERETPFAFRCPAKECGEESEIEISVREIAQLQTQAYEAEQVCVQLESGALVLRRPTGADQLAWLKTSFVNEAAAIKVMLRTLWQEDTGPCVVDPEALPSESIAVIERALEEHDPLTNYRLQVKCCNCGAENPLEIDLEEFSLRKLRQVQLRLLASVHRLASHYHWSEQEIFAVPYWRRARYLSFIDREKQ